MEHRETIEEVHRYVSLRVLGYLTTAYSQDHVVLARHQVSKARDITPLDCIKVKI